MEIKNNTSNVTSFRGNFILAKTLSKGEAELVENFNKIIYKKKMSVGGFDEKQAVFMFNLQ